MATPAPSGAMTMTDEVSSSDIGSLANLMHLLPFQRTIIHALIPGARSSSNNDGDDMQVQELAEDWDDPDVMLVLARGLGMRTIIASVLRLYDGPSNLIIVINAKAEEENGLREELTTMGVRKPGLRSITHETNVKERQELYLSGGLLCVTTRILVVDMLLKKIPTDLITGLIVLHAEEITNTCVETFVISLYRKENTDGFLKAFSDAPDHFAIGISPLQSVLTQLRIRRVEMWPRFHKSIIRDLGRKKADVIELGQDMSQSMRKIQNAIVECLEATLGELRRGTGNIDIEDATVENAIFKSFEQIVRRQLDRVWTQVGPKTKRLVADLGDLRQLLHYLLTYDSIKFHQYLESVLLAQANPASSIIKQNQSPWLLMEAANTIFSEAKARVFVGEVKSSLDEDTLQNAEEAALDEEEAAAMEALGENARPAKEQSRTKRPWWLPPGIDVSLEELPKWRLLREVLDEVEQEILWSSTDLTTPRNNTILIMVESDRTCWQLREYLSTMKTSAMGSASKEDQPGHGMMLRMMKDYLKWKQGLSTVGSNLRNPRFTATTVQTASAATAQSAAQPNGRNANYESEALKRKEIWEGGRAPLHKRRRQRGGASLGGQSMRRDPANASQRLETEADEVATFMTNAVRLADGDTEFADEAPETEMPTEVIASHFTEIDFEEYFGVLQMDDLIVIRSYAGDDDDHHLQELKPRFVIMYDSDPAFIRRLEVYRSAQPGAEDMRIYFLMYTESVEEQRYLSHIRREKESFERLIREKAMMALPLQADGSAAELSADERMLRAINSRVAGGQNTVSKEQPRVVVDVREFRSSLPYMLHSAGMQLSPCTLQVGDYILSNKICVERKSLSDLIQSFNKGRLYTQCELMSAYYTHPILLIEFDHDKAFSMQTVNETKAVPRAITNRTKPSEIDIQTKLVMLTIAFPRLRVIWSSSPYASADIFAELKQNFEEPDLATVAAVGLDESTGDETAEAVLASTSSNGDGASAAPRPRPTTVMAPTGTDNSYNLTPQDVLLSLPGITTKNYILVSRSVRDLAELCDMTVDEISHLIGAEAGRKLFDFLHKNAREKL